MKIVMTLVPDGKKMIHAPGEPLFLEAKLTGQPAAALELVTKEVIRCSELAGGVLEELARTVRKEEKELLVHVLENVENVQTLSKHITDYLSDLFAAGVMTEEQTSQTAGMMYVLSDVERIGSLCGDVAGALIERLGKKKKYSKEALSDLESSLMLLGDMYADVLEMMVTGNDARSANILKKKEKIMDLDIEMRKAHMNRVGKGKCAANLTVPFGQILHDVDRMGNCCVNIADAVTGQTKLRYFMNVQREQAS